MTREEAMSNKDDKEWKAEKKLRKAVKKLIKVKPAMLDFNTHKYVNGKKYFIRIWREDFKNVNTKECDEL